MTSYVKANLSIFFLINDQIFKLFAWDTFFDRLRVFVWHILLGHHLFLFAEYIWLYQEGFLKHLKAWSWVRILGTSPKGQINKWPHKTLRCPAHSGCDAPNWHSSYGWALEQKRPTFMLGRHLRLAQMVPGGQLSGLRSRVRILGRPLCDAPDWHIAKYTPRIKANDVPTHSIGKSSLWGHLEHIVYKV